MASTAQINVNVNAETATKSVEKLNNDIVAAGGSAASLKAELRKTIQELQGLKEGSARFQELSVKAGELRDKIADTNAVVQSLSGNFGERLAKGITNVVGIGIAGFQGIAGAMAVFGNESEDLQKTMVRLQGLLNLSQAFETLSGVPDKITEIKAAFTSLTTATKTQTVAVETEAVAQTAANIATEGGVVATTSLTTATTGLGLAMKALPIVGLVAALATLAYGVYQYFGNSEKAKKSEEARKKTLTDLKEEEENYYKTIAKESTGLVIQIERLKKTNYYSKERKDIITDINKQYGTTIQNIKDEGKFQEQLNLVVADYIAFQTIKYKLGKTEETFTKNLEKQEQLQTKINTAQNLVVAKRKQLTTLGPDDLRAGEFIQQLRDAERALSKVQLEFDKVKKANEGVANISLEYKRILEDLTKEGTRFGEGTGNNTDKLDKQAQALKNLEQITNAILGLQGEVLSVENDVFKLREENGDKSINLAEREKKQRIDAFTKTYNEIKASIEEEITDQEVKTEKLKLLDEALANFKRLLGEKEVEESKKKNAVIIDDEKKKNKSLIEEQKALQNEIQAGDGITSDTKIGLINRDLKAQLDVYDVLLRTQKIGEDISLENYNQMLLDRQGLYQKYISNLRDEQIAEADAEYQRQLKLNEDRLNADKSYLITLDENGKYRVKLTKDRETEIASLSKEEQDKVVANAVLTEENLNQTKVNLAEELVVKKTEIDSEYYVDYKTDAEQTEDEIFQNRIAQLDAYLEYAQQAFNQASSLISEFSQQQMDIAQTQLDDAIKMDKDKLDQQLEQKLITREEFDNKVEQLDQQQAQKELQLKRKNFRTEKSLNIVGATIDGARAVLSTFANTPGELITKTIAAALAGVFAATQIALIARQEFKAAQGGIVPGNGSGEIDSVPSRLAPGEAVINSRSTQEFLPLLSAINQSNGGKSFMPDLPPTRGEQKFQTVFQEDRPQQLVKAYVVESDLSQVQRRVNRIERSTSF
jgi:hypothetical protein